MGLGNQGGGGNSGNKRSNHNNEHRQLLSLGAIAAAAAGGATEATLQLVLAAINAGSDFEARLVQDSDVPPVTWLEVRVWNDVLKTWDPPVYYPAGSNIAGTPTGAVTYLNNTSVLALIEANTATNATEATLLALSAKLNTLGQKASAASAPVVLSTEQEAILTAIDTVLDNIKLDTAEIETLLTGQSRTPSVTTATLDGSTTGGVKGVTLWFRGTGGTLDGDAVPNGARFSFSADDNNDTVAAIAYTVPTGGVGEILITYLT
jgi:hypothetical protein